MKRFACFVAVVLFVALSRVGSASEILLNVEHQPQVSCEIEEGKYVGLCKCDWDNTHICGPVSLVMADAHLRGYSQSTQIVKDLIDWMVSVDIYLDMNDYCGADTDYNNLIKCAKEYYQIFDVLWKGGDSDENVNRIRDALKNGYPVIISTRTDISPSGYPHFMVVDGLRDSNNDGDYLDGDDKIHVVDPGHSIDNGGKKWYDISQLRNAWSGILLFNSVGYFDDYWHSGISNAFVDTYIAKGGKDRIGIPANNGGGYNVHYWPKKEDSSDNVIVRDLKGSIFEGDGETALIYNPNIFNLDSMSFGIVSLVKEGFWGLYKPDQFAMRGQSPDGHDTLINFFGPHHLGAPKEDERDS